MNLETGDNVLSPAKQFAAYIKTLIANSSYDAIAKVFTDKTQQQKIHVYIQEVYEDLLRDVCLKNLNVQTYVENLQLYNCADEILKQIALHAPSDNLLIELLELVEELQQDYQFTTLLRALQALLLNYGDEKSKAYDWTFNTIHSCFDQHKLPEKLSTGYDDEQAQLLEQDKLIEDLIGRYITIGLFYGPLKDEILKQSDEHRMFRDCSIRNRRNLLCCFLVQLLGKPLALLDLTVTDQRKTNSYTLQVARKLTHDLSELIIDPYYFLNLVEERERWNRRLDSSRGVFEMSSKNIFLTAERLPVQGLAIYYYMLFLDPAMKGILNKAPKVYAPYFIFESCIYLVNKLLTQKEPPLQLRGLNLAQQVLNIFMVQRRIPSSALELNVHKTFFELLCPIIGYSEFAMLRKQGLLLLKNYILLFDNEGRYLILSNILPGLSHKSLKSYLSSLYKDIVAEALNSLSSTNKSVLAPEYCGEMFKEMLLNIICRLPKGPETDLCDNAEQISAALNIIRYFALSDKNNYTGFWDLKNEIQNQIFEPLRKALDYSIAHYKLEMKQVETNWDMKKEQEAHQRAIEMVTVNINNKDKNTDEPGVLTKERKLTFLKHSLTTLDLLRSLWARTVEVMEQSSRQRHN